MMDIQEDIISIKEKIIKTDNILHKFVDVKAKYDILMKKYKWSVKELDTLKLEHDAKIYLNEMLSREIEQLKTNNSKLSGDYNSLKSSHDYDLDQLVNLQIKYQSTCKGNCENFKEKLEPLESEEKRVKKRKSRKYDFVGHFADENVKPTNSTEIESDRNEKMVTNSTDSRSNSIKIEILADENAAEQSDSNNFEVKLEEDLFNEVNKNLLSELKKAQEEKTICIETSRAKELSMYREWQEKETTWKKTIKDLEENIEQEKKSINKHWQEKEIQMKKKLEKMEQKLKKQMEDIKERIQKEKSILTSNFENKIYDMKTEWKKKEEELNKEIVQLKEKIQREKSISENFKQNEKDITLRWREEEQRWKIKISNLEKKLLSLEKNEQQVQNRVLNHEHNNVNESHDNVIISSFENCELNNSENSIQLSNLQQDEISDKEHTEDESDDIFNMMRGLRLAMISPIPELSMEHENLTNEDESVLPEHQQNGTVFKNTNEQEQQPSEILDRSDWRDRYQANRKKKRVKYQKLSVIKKAKQKFWLQLSQAFTSNVKMKSQPIRQKENMHVRKNSPLINLSESSAGSSNTLINGIADLMSKKLHPSKARTRSTKDMNILEVNKMLLDKAKQENETKSLYKKESLHKDLELSSDDEDDSALRQDKGSANLKEQDSSNAGNASFRSPYDSHISGIDTPTFVDSCYESISNPLSIESSVIDNLCEDNKGNNQLEQEDNMISEMKESVETDGFKTKVNQCTSLKLAHKHSQDIQVENIEKLIVDKDKTEELIKKINTPEKVQSCENQMSTNNFEIEYNVNNLETTQTENIKLELKKEFNSLPQDEEKFKSSNFTLDEFNEKSEILERSNEKLDNSPKLSGGNDEIKEFYQEQTEECIMEENGNNNSKELNNMLDVNCDQDNIAEKETEKNADSEIVHSENQTKEEQLDHEKVENEDLKIEYDKNSNNFTGYQEIFEMIKEESFENLNLNKNQVMKCYSGNVNKNKYIDRNICQENENNFNSKIYKEEKFEYKAPTLFSNDSSIQLKEEQENNSTGYNSDTEEESSCESNDDSITESDSFNQSLLLPNSSEEEEDIMEICNEIMNGNLNSQSKENTLTNMKHYPTPINHPTTSSAAHSIATGFKNLLAIAAATDIGFKEAATIKEYLKDLNEFLTVDATADTYTLITSEERIESDFFPNLFDSETESLCSMSFENDDYLEDGREKSVKYRVLDEPVKEEKNRSNVRIWSMFSKNNREELRMSKSFCHEDEYNKSSVAIIDNVCNKVRDTTADKTKEKSILGAGNLISEKSDDKKNDVPITSKDTICFESKPYDDNAKCFNIIKNSSDNIKEKKTELTFNNKKLDDKISSESEPNDENKKYINILKNSNEERKTELTCTEKKPEDTVLVESERFEENAKCINIVKNKDDITELPSTKNKSEYTISSESESYDENVKCINIVANAYGNITGKKSDLSSTKKKLEDTIYFESKPNDENAKCINIFDNLNGNITEKKTGQSSTEKKSEDTIDFEYKPEEYANFINIVKNSNDITELTSTENKLQDVNEHNPSILENLSPLNNTMECSYKSEQKFSQNTCNLLNLEVPSKPQKRKRGQKSALMTKSIRVYNLRNSATRVNRNNEMKANNSSQSKNNDATFEENSSNSTNSPSKAKRRKLSPLLRETRTLSKNSVGGKHSEQDIFGSPLSPCFSDDESPSQIANLNSFIPSTSTPVEKRTKRKRSTQSPSKIENFSKPCTSPIVENEIKRRSSTISPSKMQILNFSIPSTSPSVGNKSKRRRSTQSPSKVEIFNFSIPSTSPSEGNKSKRRRSTQSPSKMEILNFSIPSTSPLEENKSKRRRSTQSPSKVENSNLWKPSTSLPEEKKSKRRRNTQSPSKLENSNIINRSKSTPVKKQVKMRKSINSSNNLESSILMNQHTKNSESPAVTSNLINNVNQNSSQNEVVPCTKNKAKIKIIQDIILKSKSNEQKLGGFKRPMRTKILPACPQSPPLPKEDTTSNHQPIIIPLDKPEKLDPSKAASLFRQLITYSTEEKTTEEVARHFCNQEADYISRLIMQQIIQDKEKADAVVTHAPLMTHTQRVMLGFMLKLEKMNVYNLISTYLKVSELYLIRTTELETIESLTRMNVAICKSHGYIERMRKFCLEAFYFMGDLAIPFLFIVLTSWIEVLPPAKDSKDFPLVKVLVQLINLKTCNIPGYNLLSLRDLLNKFYEYPREPWNSDNFFKEIFTNYLKKPEAPADFTILLYTKNCECKWVCQKINDLIKPILEKVKNVNFKATIIVLIGHIMNPFIGKSHSEHVESIRKWLKEQVSDETPEIVKKSIVYSLKKFPKANKKVVNKNEKKDIVQTVNM